MSYEEIIPEDVLREAAGRLEGPVPLRNPDGEIIGEITLTVNEDGHLVGSADGLDLGL